MVEVSRETGTAERFVEAFTRAWGRPSADALAELAAEDVVLRQPVVPDLHGREAWREEAGRLLALVPDLTAELHRWATTGDGQVLIDFTLSGTLGGKPVSWGLIDRIRLDSNGLVAERTARMDPSVLVVAILTRPRCWPRWWRSGFGPPGRRRRI